MPWQDYNKLPRAGCVQSPSKRLWPERAIFLRWRESAWSCSSYARPSGSRS